MNPTQRAAMEQALEALEWVYGGAPVRRDGAAAIRALRAALAEQPAEQEPVAWWHRKSDTFTSGSLVSKFQEWTPLYTTPQPAKPAEPVAWMWKDGTLTSDPDRADGTWTPLYTTPQPAKRVPLTREHVRAAGGIVHSDGNVFFTSLDQLNSAIEAAHGITGETK